MTSEAPSKEEIVQHFQNLCGQQVDDHIPTVPK